MSRGPCSAIGRILLSCRLNRRALALSGFLLLLLASPGQAGVLDLAWDAPTTNTDGSQLTDLSSYRVYVGTSSSSCPGSTFQQVPSPTPTPSPGDVINTQITGLITGTTYVAKVTAVDANGNESVCSNQATGAAKADPLDTTAPSGSLVINSNATHTQWTAATLSLTATDGVGVTAYYVSSSSTPPSPTAAGWVAVTPTTSYSNTNVPFTLPSGNGTKTVYAWYKDAAGNVSPTASDSIILDQTAPTVSLTAPTAGQTVTGTVTVSATASDASGVAGVQFKLDGANLGAEDTTSPFSMSWNTATATNGSHTLTAVARDVAGNTTTSAGVTVTVSNALPPITSGLVAAYAFNEGSGTTTADASGNGHTGTLSGATWITTGRSGNALSFNGTSNLVNVADSNLLDLTTGMTLEAWVFPTALSSWRTVILKETSSSFAYVLYAHDNAPFPADYIKIAGTDVTAKGTASLPLNTWTHLAATYDGSTLRLFVNGTQVGSVAASGSVQVSGNPLRIGGNSLFGEYFQGRIDEVRIYNRALGVAEVQRNMTTPVSTPADTTPPTVTITSPTANPTHIASATPLAIGGTAADTVGVTQVTWVNDRGGNGTATGTTSWTANGIPLLSGTNVITVTARDAAGNSGTDTLTVTYSTLAAATLVSPSGTIGTTTPTYTWNAVSAATWYNLYVDDSTGNRIAQWYTPAQVGCGTGTGTCSITPSTALVAGAGQWWVQTYNGSGGGPWSAGMAFCVIACPTGAATLVSPSGTTGTTTPTYTWNAVSAATWYYLWVDDSTTAGKIQQWYTPAQVGCGTGTGTCSITPSTSLAVGAGKWWIQTWNPAGSGPWSGMSFTAGSLPPAATLGSPSGTISTATPTYTWNAVPTVTWYYLWVDDATGNKIKQWYTAAQAGCGSGTGTCSLTPGTALAPGAGRWWIQTWNPVGSGPWSSPLAFTR